MKQKYALIWGAAVYLILAILSVLFYKERVGMLDASFQLFDVLRKEGLAIQAHRFGAAVTQIFPLTGALLGFDLQTIGILYSLSFVLFPATCFFLILYGFKNFKLAMCLLFYNTILVAHSFYWLTCEVMQGVAFTLVFFAALEQQLRRGSFSRSFILLTPFALVTIVFFYPLLFLILGFVLPYLWLVYQRKFTKPHLLILVVYLLLFVLKSLLWSSEYDQGAMQRINNLLNLFPDYLTLQSNKDFLRYCVNDYFLVPLLFLVNVAGLLWLRQYLKLALFLSFFIGTLFLINISHPDGSDQFYLEPQYSLLSVLLALPFFYDILPAIKHRKLAVSGVSLMLLLAVLKIYNTHDFYTERLNWYRKVLKETAHLAEKKLILRESEVPLDLLKLSWAASTEFWFISTLETGQCRSIIIEERAGEFDQYLPDNKMFLGKWGPLSYSDFPSDYFNLKDTSYYKYISLKHLRIDSGRISNLKTKVVK